MPWLEYVPPSQELKKDMDAVVLAGNGKEPNACMADKALAIKTVFDKWAGKVSKAFGEKAKEIIDIAVPPSVTGKEPEFPNDKAFDLTKPDPVKAYVDASRKAWLALVDFYRNRALYEKKAIPTISPTERLVLMGQKIQSIVNSLEASTVKVIEVMGQKYVLKDTGAWPGHMVAKALTPVAEKYFKEMSVATVPANMVQYKYHELIPGEKKEAPKPESQKPMPEPEIKPAPKSESVKPKEKAKK